MPGIIRIAVAAGIACIAALLGACSKSGDAGSSPPPPQVSVAAVLEKRVKDWDEFTGRFQAVETVEIRPRVSGYIDKVAFKEGAEVKRGDLLFVIDPRPYQAEYDRAAADLKRYKTALDLARIESVRVRAPARKRRGVRRKNSTSARARSHKRRPMSRGRRPHSSPRSST